jgi:hypothetical protein
VFHARQHDLKDLRPLPISPIEPARFSVVSGCFQIGAGGANNGVGDEAAW